MFKRYFTIIMMVFMVLNISGCIDGGGDGSNAGNQHEGLLPDPRQW